MRRIIGDAIVELRRSKGWSQAELAREISRHARRGMPAPDITLISHWEAGVVAPAPEHRIALARIARGETKPKPGAKKVHTESPNAHLAKLFLGSAASWEMVKAIDMMHERQHDPS